MSLICTRKAIAMEKEGWAHLQVLHSCPVKAALKEGGPVSVKQERGAGVQRHVSGGEAAPCESIKASSQPHSAALCRPS